MNVKLIILENRIMTIILAALAAMWLMPQGSFDPRHPGFYTSIAFAVITEIATWKLIKAARAKKAKENNK